MVYPYLYGTLISENGFLTGRGVDSDEDRRSGARLHRAGWLEPWVVELWRKGYMVTESRVIT